MTDVAGVATLVVVGVLGGLILAVAGEGAGARWCGLSMVVVGVLVAGAAVRHLRRPVEGRD